MIFESFLVPFLYLVNVILSYVPSFTLPSEVVDAFSGLFYLIGGAAYFLPLPQLSIALLIVIYFHFAEFIIAGAGWILRKFPGIG